MKHLKFNLLILICMLSTSIKTNLVFANSNAGSILEQWKAGLAGSRLTAYSGSAISSNSSLTVLNFCKNGRYTYQKEASWNAEGYAAGASKNRIVGLWNITQQGNQFYLNYKTDSGDNGQFFLYLQSNGRVNIGGVGYAVEKSRAIC